MHCLLPCKATSDLPCTATLSCIVMHCHIIWHGYTLPHYHVLLFIAKSSGTVMHCHIIWYCYALSHYLALPSNAIVSGFCHILHIVMHCNIWYCHASIHLVLAYVIVLHNKITSQINTVAYHLISVFIVTIYKSWSSVNKRFFCCSGCCFDEIVNQSRVMDWQVLSVCFGL